jgi:CysZ protein
MISALIKALAQLSDPALRKILRFGVAGALLAYVLLVGLAWWGLAETTWAGTAWVDRLGHWVAGLLVLLLPLPFFPALATAIVSLRLDEAAAAVEARYYPASPPPRAPSWAEILGSTLRFLGITVVLNLLALPLYGILLLAGAAALAGLVVNGYLLGREYYELVAFRHLPPAQARLLFRNRLGRLWLAGIVIALLFGIPGLNLLAPVIGTAFMVHLFHALPFQALRPTPEDV